MREQYGSAEARRPLTGARIEIRLHCARWIGGDRRPLTGARIEIMRGAILGAEDEVAPSRGRGLK